MKDRGDVSMLGARVIIDNAELKGGIPKYLERLGCDYEFQKLEVGDYVVSDICAIERKFKDDFKQSLIGDEKGKIFRHVYDLIKSYKRPILVIECEYPDLFSMGTVHPNAIFAVLQSFTEHGCAIRFTNDKEGTAKYILRKAEEEQFGKTKLFNPHGSKTKRSPREQKEYLVSAIPEVGPALAVRLLGRFKTIKTLGTASIEELMEIERMPKSTAEKIKQIFNEQY